MRTKKIISFLMLVMLLVPLALVPQSAKAAEVDAQELLAKVAEAEKTITSCETDYFMDLKINYAGKGTLINAKLSGNETSFSLPGGYPVKSHISMQLKYKENKNSMKLLTKQKGRFFDNDTYKLDTYFFFDYGNPLNPAMTAYGSVESSADKTGWIKLSATMKELLEVLSSQNNAISKDALFPQDLTGGLTGDFTGDLSVSENGDTYVISQVVKVTEKMLKDSLKNSGLYDSYTKKEKKQIDKEFKRLAKKLKPIKIEYVINKESSLPVEISIDYNDYFNSALKAGLTSDSKDKDSIKLSKKLSISGAKLVVTTKNINSAADFDLSAEAEKALEIPFQLISSGVAAK